MSFSSMFWDRVADTYDQKPEEYRELKAEVLRNTIEYIKKTDTVLDYGCGTGEAVCALAGLAKKVQGIDFSTRMISHAEKKANGQGLANVVFRKMTIWDKSLRPNSFDVITASGILHLVRNRSRVIKRIHALLKPNGLFISSTACIGGRKIIPHIMNTVGFITKAVPLLPSFNFPSVETLERQIHNREFDILETDTHFFSRQDDASSATESSILISRFIAARKSNAD